MNSQLDDYIINMLQRVSNAYPNRRPCGAIFVNLYQILLQNIRLDIGILGSDYS